MIWFGEILKRAKSFKWRAIIFFKHTFILCKLPPWLCIIWQSSRALIKKSSKAVLIWQFLGIHRPVPNRRWILECYYPWMAFGQWKKEKHHVYQSTCKWIFFCYGDVKIQKRGMISWVLDFQFQFLRVYITIHRLEEVSIVYRTQVINESFCRMKVASFDFILWN